MCESHGYNERLFYSRGLRRHYHLARFNWVAENVAKHLSERLRVVELGCFDGRLLDSLGAKVEEYVGLDANWEGGLDRARAKHGGRPGTTFIEASDPSVFERFADGQFNLAATLETLEHVPPEMVPGFLDELARVTRGHAFITVPNELGPVFLVKYLGKRFRYGGGESYTVRELVAALLWRSNKIERNDHKGFDYRNIVCEIGKRFDVLSVDGISSLGLPPAVSPTVGIFAKSRAK